MAQTSAGILPANDGSRKPNIIIYLVDTLRADHLGCYGYEKPISPNIDAFARDAAVFTNAIAQSSWTRPSVASIFTGLSAKTHGANDYDEALSGEATTLAEILRARGYHTTAFLTNIQISKATGFGQGFDEFIHLPWDSSGRSDRLNENVSMWLDKMEPRQRPFFLYVHTMDPHSPYTPPDPYKGRFVARLSQPELGTISHLKLLHRDKISVTESLTQDLVSLYDAEIAFNDHNFGALLKELQRRGLYEESLIIFISDHGEEFYEHGRWEHGKTLYAEVLNIPLLVKFPSSSNIGAKKIPDLAQHIDILPTIVDYLGLEIPKQVEGHSLLPLLSTGQANQPPRRGFSYLKHRGVQAASVVEGRWKLIRQGTRNRHESYLHLFDHEQDPDEGVNLIDRHPVVAGYLLFLMRAHERSRTALKPPKAVIDEELRERLKALGYVQ